MKKRNENETKTTKETVKRKDKVFQVCLTEAMADKLDKHIAKSDAFVSRSEFVRFLIAKELGA